jgi:flagellar biosynthesis protein FlhF
MSETGLTADIGDLADSPRQATFEPRRAVAADRSRGAAAFAAAPATAPRRSVIPAAETRRPAPQPVDARRGGLQSAEPRRLVLKSSDPRWSRPADPSWAQEGGRSDNRWESDETDSPRASASAAHATVAGDVPWEYRDEPLTGASRWMIAEPEPKDAHVEAIISRLCATGLHREMAEFIALGVPKEQRRNGSSAHLERAAAEHLSDLAAGEEGYAPVELFVGPPGAGKTTTIAKIAAQERARRGARLSLVAADGFRVGAVEQLRIYADIIGAPFAIARTLPDIEQALLASRGTVLIDTAGRSVRDPRAQEVLALLAGIPGVRTHFVIAAATSVRDVNRMLDAYGKRRPNRVVLTRIDEADSVSPLMHVFRERGLKVSFLGVGQRVPEDLERATSQRLAAHVLGHGLPQGISA